MEDEEGIDKKVFNKRYTLVKSLDVKYLIASIFKAQISSFSGRGYYTSCSKN